MLTPEELSLIPDSFDGLFQQLDEYIMQDYARRIAKAAGVTDTAGTSDIARIMQATQRNAAHAADSRTQAGTEEIQKAYDSMNPHRKETK